jgi:hypothetical protein
MDPDPLPPLPGPARSRPPVRAPARAPTRANQPVLVSRSRASSFRTRTRERGGREMKRETVSVSQRSRPHQPSCARGTCVATGIESRPPLKRVGRPIRRTVPSRRARRGCAAVSLRPGQQRHCAAPVQLGHSGAYGPDLGLCFPPVMLGILKQQALFAATAPNYLEPSLAPIFGARSVRLLQRAGQRKSRHTSIPFNQKV